MYVRYMPYEVTANLTQSSGFKRFVLRLHSLRAVVIAIFFLGNILARSLESFGVCGAHTDMLILLSVDAVTLPLVFLSLLPELIPHTSDDGREDVRGG